ncbi:MAG: hypothetical protein ABUK01_14815 [Leptospirales bacterium]
MHPLNSPAGVSNINLYLFKYLPGVNWCMLSKKRFFLLSISILCSILLSSNYLVAQRGQFQTRNIICDAKTEITINGVLTQRTHTKKDEQLINKLLKEHAEGEGFTVSTVSNVSTKYCKKDIQPIFVWIDMEDDDLGLSSAVHEETHSFTGTAYYDMLGKFQGKRDNSIWFQVPAGWYSSFYLEEWGTHHLKHGLLFDSIKITKIMPVKKFKTTRLETYILGSQHMASRQFGIYGLLDEYHAYYHGYRVSRSMHEAGIHKEISDEFTSFAEFTLYILKYLQYAKERHPRIYKATMKQKEVLETFIRVHDKFEKIFCKGAEVNDESNKNVFNYEKTGDVTYNGHSCNVTMSIYETVGEYKGFYSFSKSIESYIHELETPKMVQMMEEARRVAGIK